MKKAILLMLCFGLSSSIFAQTPRDEKIMDSLRQSDLLTQYKSLINFSPEWNGFKSVRSNQARLFEKNLNDSIRTYENEISQLNSEIQSKDQEIESLNGQVNERNDNISNLNDQINEISLLGIQTNKTTYNSFMLGTIGILTLALLMFVYKFNNANSITRQAKRDLEEIETEFEAHRKTALKREQKVMRKLQDEINKNKS